MLKNLSALFVFLFLFFSNGIAQSANDSSFHVQDSLRRVDSLQKAQQAKDSLLLIAQQEIQRTADSIEKATKYADSVNKVQEIAKRKKTLAVFQETLAAHPYFNFDGEPENLIVEIREKESDEGIFYFILALVLYLALMRLIFPKYMATMFILFFRATLRQQQLRDQMLQSPLPSLLMNIYFVICLAAYSSFLSLHFNIGLGADFWTGWLYAMAAIAIIYIGKFIFLNIAGWIFGIKNATDTYLFIIFLINKILGIFLLPFLVLIAFPTDFLLTVVLTISYIMLVGMFIYRFLIAYRPLRSEIKLTRLHFFLYICAFEIAPLLLIYKVLLAFVERSL